MNQTRRTFIQTLSGAPVFGPRFQAMLARRKKQKGLAQSPKVAQARKSWWTVPKSITAADVTLKAPSAPPPLAQGQFGITKISVGHGQVTLTWQNAQLPFQVEGRASLISPWMPVENPTVQRQISFAETLPMEFFRVQQQPKLFFASASSPRLVWMIPNL